MHTLSYLFILHSNIATARGKSNKSWPKELLPGSEIWSRLTLFLKTFDPVLVRYAGQEWRQLVELTARSAEAVSKARRTGSLPGFFSADRYQQPLLAIAPIREAMLRLDPSCATFTSTHVLFLRLCLHAKAYSDALPVIDKYIFHFPGSHTSLSLENRRPACSKHDSSAAFITDSSGLSAKLTHKDHMQYSLYGGMIYMAVKRWSQALHLLDIAVSSPVTSAVSMIMVEAYKKMILVSLLERGKVAPLPTIITSQVGKIYRSLARPYMALAGAFEGGDYAKLRAEVTIGKAIWHAVRPLFFFFCPFFLLFWVLTYTPQDGNLGLVFQVMDKFHTFAVSGLGKCFSALSLEDVADRISLRLPSVEKMESFVASAIMSGSVNAVLSHSPNDATKVTLHFLPTTLKSQASRETLVQKTLAQEALLLKILLDNSIASGRVFELSTEYVENLRRTHKSGSNGARAETSMSLGRTAEFDDEDMMEGLA